jgi:hypothetical protein
MRIHYLASPFTLTQSISFLVSAHIDDRVLLKSGVTTCVIRQNIGNYSYSCPWYVGRQMSTAELRVAYMPIHESSSYRNNPPTLKKTLIWKSRLVLILWLIVFLKHLDSKSIDPLWEHCKYIFLKFITAWSEFWGFHDGHVSSQVILVCDAV